MNLFVVQIVNGGEQTWAASLPAVRRLRPADRCCSAIAVLRYRLYDVEVILNRTLVLALGTAFAAIGYTTLVVLVGARVGPDSGGVWLSLLATALVALAFQPLRRQVIRLANRLAYGSRAQPYEALSDFSRRLAETPVAGRRCWPRSPRLPGRAVAAQRCDRRCCTLAGGAAVAAQLGRPAADAGRRPRGRGPARPARSSGRIRVLARQRDAGPPVPTVRLLEGLADQTAVAFRNVGAAGPAGRPRGRARPDDGGPRPAHAPGSSRPTTQRAGPWRGRSRATCCRTWPASPAASPVRGTANAAGPREHRARRAWSSRPTPRSRRCAT